MYQVIRAHPTARELYATKLVGAEGVIADADAQALVDNYRKKLDAGTPMRELDRRFQATSSPSTGRSILRAVSTEPSRPACRATSSPSSVARSPCCRRVSRCIRASRRSTTIARKMAAGEQPIDWGFAENLAYATLIDDGYDLRLVGQDSGRGTFFHRHAVLHDQNTGGDYVPLTHSPATAANVAIVDSLLSRRSGAWASSTATRPPSRARSSSGKAQFGDFANGAQVVIDQFISRARPSGTACAGWRCSCRTATKARARSTAPRASNASCSSARRDNMQVCVPTTPAQMFHMLRRQMLRGRSQAAHRDDAEVAAAPQARGVDARRSRQRQFPARDPGLDREDAKKVRRVVLCSGKVYYDLLEDAAKRKIDRCRDRARRAALSVPAQGSRGRARALSRPRRKSSGARKSRMNQGAWYQITHHLDACICAASRPCVRGPLALAGAGVRAPCDASRRAGCADRARARRGADWRDDVGGMTNRSPTNKKRLTKGFL